MTGKELLAGLWERCDSQDVLEKLVDVEELVDKSEAIRDYIKTQNFEALQSAPEMLQAVAVSLNELAQLMVKGTEMEQELCLPVAGLALEYAVFSMKLIAELMS